MLRHQIERLLDRDPSCIVLRDEFSDIGSRGQVTNLFKQMVESGLLFRLGAGIYEKSVPDKQIKTGKDKDEYVCALVKEVFLKLQADVGSIKVSAVSGDKVCFVDVGSQRISRKLEVHGIPVRYIHNSSGQFASHKHVYSLPDDVDKLPVKNVRSYIERFAAAHDVKCKRTGLDDFAESVTRMAGDEIELDSTEKLLVALKRKALISGRQLARLMTNYMREEKNVRSVRGLRNSRLPAQC